uniref:Ig-like domain-containing protein n=1 Tax=Monopterus albus TaxID=43700 RepID=A0A3Q3QVM2_MONAL
VRAGDEVTLSCENMLGTLDRCDSTVWLFSGSRFTAAVELIKLGRIGEEARSKSDRLSVTESCSLVIKKVTAEDAGRYICRQLDTSRRQQHQDSVVFLSVVT